MSHISNEDYITTRLDEQQKWFSRKSDEHQKMYKRYKQIAIAITIAAPIVNYLRLCHNKWLIFDEK